MAEFGRIGRPHGMDGSFHVTRPVASGLAADTLSVAGSDRRVVRRAGTVARPILRLEGIDGRPAIEALRGTPLEGPEPELADDEYRAEDLAGCRVTDGADEVGVVARMVALPSCEALELTDGRLVPMVRDAIRCIDIAARRVDADMSFLGPAGETPGA